MGQTLIAWAQCCVQSLQRDSEMMMKFSPQQNPTKGKGR